MQNILFSILCVIAISYGFVVPSAGLRHSFRLHRDPKKVTCIEGDNVYTSTIRNDGSIRALGAVYQGNKRILSYDDLVDDDVLEIKSTDSQRLTTMEQTLSNLAFSHEVQSAYALREAVVGKAGISTVEGVHHNVIIQNGNSFQTPDLYIYGLLTNGTRYEAVGDGKLYGGHFTKEARDKVQGYKKHLMDPKTSVVARGFAGPRIRAPSILTVLAFAGFSAVGYDDLKDTDIVILGPSGGHLQVIDPHDTQVHFTDLEHLKKQLQL